MKFNSVLIVNTFGIGDVLFSTPLIREIKKSAPGVNVHFLCNRRNRDLLKNDPDLKNIVVFEKDEYREVFKRSKIEFLWKIKNFINDIRRLNIDVAIDLTLNYQMRLLLILAGIRRRIGFSYKDRGAFLTEKKPLSGFEGKHVVMHYVDLLDFLGIRVSDNMKLLSYSSQEDKHRVDMFIKENGLSGKTLVGIAAGGGKSWGKDAVYRRWGSENFAYIGKKLSEWENIRILIFGTIEEKAACDSILAAIGDKALSLCGLTELGILVEFIKRCKLVICNEGGILHIAVSQGVNTISIFGPVDFNTYGPFPSSEMHRVVTAEGLACCPCYRNFKHAICETKECLRSIDKEKVLAVAKESLRFVHTNECKQ